MMNPISGVSRGLVCFLAIWLVPSSEASKNHVAISYDVSGSMGAKYIGDNARARAMSYLQWLLLEGWDERASLATDRLIVLKASRLKSPLLSQESQWSVYFFGDSVVTVQHTTNLPPMPSALDAMYPTVFADRNTRLAEMRERVCEDCEELALKGVDFYWVLVSDAVADYSDDAEEMDMLDSELDKRCTWDLLFSLEVVENKRSRDDTHSFFIKVFAISPSSELEAAKLLLEKALSDPRAYLSALEAYEGIAKAHPNDGVACAGRAESLYGLGRKEEAIAAIDNAIRIETDNDHFYFLRGRYLYSLERHEEAREAFLHATELNSKAWNAHLFLGHISFEVYEDEARAITHYSEALESEPGCVEARFHRALVFRILGQTQDAQQDFLEVRRNAPDSRWAAIAAGYLESVK